MHAPFFSVSFVLASPKRNDKNILHSYFGANSLMKTKSGSKELRVQNMRLSETKLLSHMSVIPTQLVKRWKH